MNPAITERLVSVVQAARNAPHGSKTAIYQNAAAQLHMSLPTLMRKLKDVTVPAPRKRRFDAGQTALSYEDAQLISALLIESTRKNGKQLLSIPDAVQMLRANGEIIAGRLDPETGKLCPLSDSTIARALRGYGLHPEQLNQPAPVTELASRHPNHVWQIDASLCTLYYLANGLQGMAPEVFYKNKPQNMERIAANRLWRYVITDHTSGWLYVEYVLGAESGENLCAVLINAMQERADSADMMHGVPRMLMLDPGAANTAGMTRNLLRTLGVTMIVNKVGNARAKGQVENANNLVETKFEPGLKLQRIQSLEDLNQIAAAWRGYFNASATHSRTQKTRNSAWMMIRPDQLIKAPSVKVCRELAVAVPISRKVTPNLRVSFKGPEYDVSAVPGVMVGEKLMITRNPWRTDAAQVVLVDEDGQDRFFVVPMVERNEHGFNVAAPVIGEAFKSHAHTPAQHAAQAIEQLVTGTATTAEAETARKAKALPFGGRIDPYKHVADAALPDYLPRRGTEHRLRAPQVEFPPLTLIEAAKQLKPKLAERGLEWGAASYTWLSDHYPDGVPVDDLDNVVAALVAEMRPGLRIVNS